MGGVSSVGACVRGWRESNFSIYLVGRVGPQNVGEDKKVTEVLKSRNFSVGEAYDFMNFRYDTMTFYL